MFFSIDSLGAPKPPEKKHVGYSVEKKEVPDYDAIRAQAVALAIGGLKKGETLTADQKLLIGKEAVEDAAWRASQRNEIAQDFPGSHVATASEDMPLKDFLLYPLVQPYWDPSSKMSVEGMFPGIENVTIRQGDHLVIEKGGKNIRLVHAEDSDTGYTGNTQLAFAERDEGAYELALAEQQIFTVGPDGRVRFKNRMLEQKTTLGQMYSKPALLVNDTLVVRGDDDQYHEVVGKNDQYTLKKARVIVLNGTKIDEDVPADQLAQIMSSIRKESPGT